MITIPLLDFFMALLVTTFSLINLYQGWSICFRGSNSPLFIYSVLTELAEFLGDKYKYRDWVSSTLTPKVIKMQGVYALIGGFLGLILGLGLFLIGWQKIKIG
jgi:hypothetical protein